MAAIVLPKPTRETEISIREISRARDMAPATSGPTQRQDRMGTRHSIRFEIPVLRYAWCGAGMAADLAVGRTGDGVIMQIPEPKIPAFDYGTPRVKGAGQLGDKLIIDGIPVGTVIKKGKWLSVLANNRYYSYFTTKQDVVVDGTGTASLDIYPMIRRSPADNAVVILDKPVIQGLIKEPLQRKILRVGGIGLEFEVEEQE